jgi:hypothetical protein
MVVPGENVADLALYGFYGKKWPIHSSSSSVWQGARRDQPEPLVLVMLHLSETLGSDRVLRRRRSSFGVFVYGSCHLGRGKPGV